MMSMMTRLVPLALLAPLVMMACGGAGTPEPRTPVAAASQPAAPTAASPSAPAAAAAAAPEKKAAPTADVSGDVLAVMTCGSLDAFLKQGVGYIAPHLPPGIRSMIQPGMLKKQLFSAIKAPDLERAIDLGRGFAVALADPRRYRGRGLGPLMVALPVKDQDLLISQLGRLADQHEGTPHGDHIYTIGSMKLHLRIHGTHALLTVHETLLRGAAAALLPAAQKAPPASSISMRVDMAKINARYGDMIQAARARLNRKMKQASPDGAASLGQVLELMTYATQVERIDLALDLTSSNIGLVAGASAAAGGSLSAKLGKLNQGPAWGAAYLPADSAFAVLHRSDLSSAPDDAMLGLKLVLGKTLAKDELAKIVKLMSESIRHHSGEMAFGGWVDGDGGISFVLAQKVSDAAKVQASMRAMAAVLVKKINQFAKKKKAPFKLRFRKDRIRLAGVKGDALELAIRWPRPGDRAARAEQKKIKKGVTKLFGRRPKLAHVVVGDASLIVFGKDRKQLARMIAVARKKSGGGMTSVVARHLGGAPMISFLHLPLVSLAEQVMRAVEQVAPIPAFVKSVYQDVLLPARSGQDVSVTGRLSVAGPRLQWKMDVSPTLVGLIAKATMAAFQRFKRRANRRP